MIERISEMLERCSSDKPCFPPTVLYNEGWMLRLILDWFSRYDVANHPLSFPVKGKWYSEARLPSPFLPQNRRDKKAEGYTHADGIIGHFEIGNTGKSDIVLRHDASHLVVLEAKMFSKLSSGTTHAKYYNQAARNVACIAEVLKRGTSKPSDFSRLGFYVLAPETQISDGVFDDYMNPDHIRTTVAKRVDNYKGESKRMKQVWLEEWFNTTMDRISIDVLSWESILETISRINKPDGDDLMTFLHHCVKHNGRMTRRPRIPDQEAGSLVPVKN